MRYLGRCALLGVAFFSCTPSLDNNPPPDVVTARFDPSIQDVPTPTDLVRDPASGRLHIPDGGNLSPAELELIGYLNTLDGYPPDTPAYANFDSNLQPNSVTRGSVQVVDITTPTAPAPVATTPQYADVGNPPKGQIRVIPATGWTTGHRYMVALIAGTNGLMGAGGRQVVGSAVWALVSSQTPLVSCPNNNFADPGCRATTDLIPSRETDPARRIADQAATAIQLERIRLGYAPLINALAAQGVNRSDIVLLWTFTILSRPVMTFDPANQVIPFPNNLAALPLPDGGLRVNLPIPDGGSTLQAQLLAGLNTLDGFSTTAPIVSENSDPLPALSQGLLDPATITDGGTGVVNLNPVGIQPQIRPCLTDIPNANCLASNLPDGGMPNNPEQLQLIPTVPLIERTNYIAYFTDNLKDRDGGTVAATSAWALMRNRNPLVDASGNSTISTVPTTLAQQLEPARQSMKQALDALEQGNGITREHLVLATVFRTQSEATTLRQLRVIANPTGPDPLFLFPASAITFFGEIVVPNLLTGPGGVFNPASPRLEKIPFFLLVPQGTPPAGGWPITIFGHGLTRSRLDTNALGQVFTINGTQAIVAIDTVWHGDRATCIGSAPFLNSGAGPCGVIAAQNDDAACANSSAQYCCADPVSCPSFFATSAGRCVPHDPTARTACDPNVTGVPGDVYCSNVLNPPQGRCLPDLKCEGAYFRVVSPTDPTPCISGQNILNLTNLFATRDNFRQDVLDLTQVARMIQSTDPTNSLNARLLTRRVDPTKITYLGQSLGSILGSLYTQVAPEIQNVVLNVPGSDLPTILLTSPAFAAAANQFLATLAAQNPPITPGTPAFDDFIGIAKWITDPADPINAGFGVLNGANLPATRKALIQYITRDQVIPNPTTLELINAANQTLPSGRLMDVCQFNPSDAQLPLPARHGFLLNNVSPADTMRAQTQARDYLTNTAYTCP